MCNSSIHMPGAMFFSYIVARSCCMSSKHILANAIWLGSRNKKKMCEKSFQTFSLPYLKYK